jgi:hypothetical protein
MKNLKPISSFSVTKRNGLYLTKAMLLICFTVCMVGSNLSVKAQSYVPITVTGFNADLIANGTGTVIETTTNGFDSDDSGGANYYVAGYSTGTSGLPVNGVINSASTTGVTYQLANYTGNNALLLVNLNEQGTLTFSNPGSFSSLAICAASAGTPNTATSFTARLNFSDGSYTIYSFSVPDWFDGGTYSITGVDRVYRNGTFHGTTTNPKLFDCIINLSAGDMVKVVNSIQFTKTVSNDRTGIFAVCGVTAVGAPLAPTATSATSVGGTSFTANWTAPSGGYTPTAYLLDVATNNTFSNLVPGYNNINVGLTTSHAVSGLNASTAYYYRVRATNASGTGPNSNIISVTTINPIPSDPSSIVASNNPICNGASLTLTANDAVGTVYWYTGSCGGTQIGTGNPISVSPTSNTTYYARNYNGNFSSSCAQITINVEPNPVSGTLTKTPDVASLCQGSAVSATLSAGTGGNGTDELEYRTNNGSDWSSWGAYTSGTSISTNGLSEIEIQTRRIASTCTSANYNTVSWTINPLLQYRTAQSGNWTDPANWQQYNGTTWVAATSYPGQISNGCDAPLVTIKAGDQMKIQPGSNISIPNLKIEGTGKLTIKSGGKIFVQDQLQLDQSSGAAAIVVE